MFTFRRRHGQPSRLGMTLLEVLLVLAILSVVAAMVVPALIGRQKQANIDATKLSLNGLEQAIKMYATDHLGEFPTTDQGIEALLIAPNNDSNWKGPYLEKRPRDAWGRAFLYQSPGQHRQGWFDLYSPGPDGLPDTDDDITNWEDEELASP